MFLLAASVHQIFPDEDAYWDDRFGDLPLEGGVNAILAQEDQVIVGGNFILSGMNAARIARWDGIEWENLGASPTGLGATNVFALRFHQNELFVGGNFEGMNGIPASSLSRWNGERWLDVHGSMSQGASVFTLLSTRFRFYAGGSFSRAGADPPTSVNHVAFWDGRQWFPLDTGVRYPIEGPHGTRDFGQVTSMLLVEERLIVGGAFSEAGSLNVSNIAQWDGREWSAMGAGLNGVSRSLAAHDGMVHAAGRFGRPNLPPVLLARWNGTDWEHISGPEMGVGATARALAATSRELFIGGQTFEINGSRDIVRLAQGEWSGLGSGVDAGVFALEARNGLLYVGGFFNTAGGKPARGFSIYHLPKTLKVDRLEEALRISWPKPDLNFVLEWTANLDDPRWEMVTEEPFLLQNRWTVLQPFAQTPRFYRLRERASE